LLTHRYIKNLKRKKFKVAFRNAKKVFSWNSNGITYSQPTTYTHLSDRAFPIAGPRLFCPNYDSPTLPSSVPPGVKDVFVWLTETPASSDFCF